MPKLAASLACALFVAALSPAFAAESAEGELTRMVKAIRASEYREPCDDKYGDLRLEVAKALDARAEALAKLAAAPEEGAPAAVVTEAEFRSVKLGSTFATESVAPFAESKEAWVTSVHGWEKVSKFYAAMKNDPVNSNWAGLNGWVRGILVDDYNRVVGGTVFAFDETAGPAIDSLRPAVEACWKDPACEVIQLDAAQQKLLAGQPFYAELFGQAAEARTKEERRGRISQLGMRLREDAGQFAFAKNAHVRALGGGSYEVSVDPGPFAGAGESEIRRVFEATWSAPGRQVKLLFKDRKLDPSLFALRLDAGVGGRSFVDYEKREVVLFPGVRTRAIAHEIGHVLGFPDVYFTIWDGEACVYGVRKNKQDLMSDPNTGAVLASHWQRLAEQYPAKEK